jgi:hypothetical protein
MDSGYNATHCLLVFETDRGPVEIAMPLAITAETVFDIQTLLKAAYAQAGGSPFVPGGSEADRPARSVEVLHDPVSKDQVLRVTFADGTGVGIRLDRRVVDDAIRALQSPS